MRGDPPRMGVFFPATPRSRNRPVKSFMDKGPEKSVEGDLPRKGRIPFRKTPLPRAAVLPPVGAVDPTLHRNLSRKDLGKPPRKGFPGSHLYVSRPGPPARGV